MAEKVALGEGAAGARCQGIGRVGNPWRAVIGGKSTKGGSMQSTKAEEDYCSVKTRWAKGYSKGGTPRGGAMPLGRCAPSVQRTVPLQLRGRRGTKQACYMSAATCRRPAATKKDGGLRWVKRGTR